MIGNFTSGCARLALVWLWLVLLGTLPALAQVPPGNALDFLQNSTVTTGTELPNYNNNFTVEAWVRTGSAPRYITTFVTTGDNFYLGIYGYNDPTWGGKAVFHVHSTFIFSTTSINDGKWHHVAGVNNNGAAAIYVDGVLEATGSGGGQNYSGDPSLQLRLGSFDTVPYEYGVDEVRIWSSARSAAQVKAAFNNVITPLPQAGLDVYYNFDRGTAGGSNAGVNTLPNLGSAAGYTGTLNNFALTGTTANWIESYALVQPTNLAATSNAAGTSLSVSWTAPPVGTISNYVLDCATTADFSAGLTTLTPAGNATSATVTSRTPNTRYWLRLRADKASVTGQGAYSRDQASLRTAGGLTPPGNALALDGTDDYATGTNALLPQGNAARTLEAWVLTTTTGGVIFNYGTATNNQRSGVLVSGGGHLYYVGEFNDLEGRKTITDGHWHHVAATYDGTALKLYVDGVLDISSTPSAFGTNGTTWRLGSRILTGTSLGEQLNGRLDEVRAYSTALTAAQVQADMTSTTPAVPASLVAYYDCDQGTAGGANAGQTTLVDRSPNFQDGTLVNFALTNANTTSNWVESYALVLPTLTAASSLGTTGFTVNWTAPAVGTVSNYVLDYSLSATFAAGVTTLSPAANTTSQAVSGLQANRTYYLRLRADKNTVSGQGAYSLGSARTAPALTPPGNALAFDGADDYVALPNTTPVPTGNGTYTLEAWIKPTAMGVAGIIGWGNWGTTNQVNALRLSPTGIVNYWWGPDLIVTTPDLSGRWHHVAATFDGTTRTIYLDGAAVGSDTPGSHTVPSPSNLRIGCTNAPSSGANYEYFNGSIDEVRIWSVARTAAQVQAAYLSQPTAPQAGLVAAYNFDHGTAGGSNAAFTTLTDQSGNGNDGTLGNFALTTGNTSNWVESYALAVPALAAATGSTATGFTANWTAPALGTVDNGYRLDVATSSTFAAGTLLTPAAGQVVAGTSQAVTGLDPAQTYYYRVRADKTTVTGTGANSLTGIRRPATPLLPPGNALAFDGSDDYVAVAPNPALDNLGLGSLTMEAWVYATNLPATNSIIRKSGDYNLVLLAGGLLFAEVWPGGLGTTARPYTTATTAIPANRWTHVAATWDGTALQLYVNGVAVASTPNSGPVATNEPLQIGRSAAYNQPFNGRLDEVRIYNAALTAAQVLADMTSTSASLPGSLQLYYNFDHGTANGANTAYPTVADQSANLAHGTLTGFNLTAGNFTSNWVESYALLQPTGLAVSARTSTSFTASFTAPTINGAAPAAGEVEGYVLDVATNSSFATPAPGSPFALSGYATTSQAVTGLANGTNYYLHVRAEKASVTSQGAYSATVNTHTIGTDAKLASLVPSAGALSPAFATATLSYTLYLPAGTSTYTLTPTASNSYTGITVNGAAVASGTASGSLSVGSTATVVLTSEDGNTTGTYTVQAVAAPGYFRSVATGNWDAPATWEASYDGSTGWFAAPVAPTGNFTGTVTVRNGNVVTVANATSTKTTTIESGGIVNTLTGATLTIPNGSTMTVAAGGVLSIGKLSGADGVTGTSLNTGLLSVTGTNALAVSGTLVLSTSNTSPATQGLSSTTTTVASGGRVVQYATAVGISMPALSWSAGSTLELAGGTLNQTYGVVNQTLQNLDVNLTTLPAGTATAAQPYLFTAGATVIVAGTLTVRSTGVGTLRLFNAPTGTLTLGSVDGGGNRIGGYVQQAGTNVVGAFGGSTGTGGSPLSVVGSFQLNGGTFAAAQASSGVTTTLRTLPLTVAGDFSVASGATFNLLSAAQSPATLYLGGTVVLNGNFSNAGTVSTGNTASTTQKLQFGKAGVQSFSNSGSISGLVNALVISGSTLDLGTQAFTGAGTFTTNSGGTLRLGSPVGISPIGTATGNVQSTGTRNLNGNVEFVGPAAQVTGTGLPATLPTTSTLIINNPAGVTLSQATALGGTLQLKQGVLTTTATNLLTLGTSATVPGVLDATATNTGRVAGPFQRWIGTSTGSRDFPVGLATVGRPANITYTAAPTTGGTLTAEFIVAPAGSQGLPLTEGSITVNKASGDGYWHFTATGLAGGTYTPTLTFTGIRGAADYTQLVLLKRADAASDWALVGTHVTTTGSGAAPVLSRTGVTGFSDFTAGGDFNVNPLPVELTAFTATAQGPAVALSWRTATEKNSRAFEVERSLSGSSFERIGTVTAAGTSTAPHTYELLDTNPPTHQATIYYRLKQVDLDGTFSYSPIRTVALAQPLSHSITLFPNPAHGGAATLAGAAPGTAVTVLDALGRTVTTTSADATGTAVLTLPAGLPAGVYLVRAGHQALRLTVE
ncbi:LamG-like jellyroll fold domain-containing protein [Hymenobacter ruber]